MYGCIGFWHPELRLKTLIRIPQLKKTELEDSKFQNPKSKHKNKQTNEFWNSQKKSVSRKSNDIVRNELKRGRNVRTRWWRAWGIGRWRRRGKQRWEGGWTEETSKTSFENPPLNLLPRSHPPFSYDQQKSITKQRKTPDRLPWFDSKHIQIFIYSLSRKMVGDEQERKPYWTNEILNSGAHLGSWSDSD